MNQIELVGGPLDGCCHELCGTLMPGMIGLPDGNIMHWYEVRDDDKAYFVHSLTMEPLK